MTFPTRSTDSSSTLIDVILTNNLRRFLCAEAVEVHFVGHILICVAVNYHLPRAQPKFISYRKTKDLNPDQLIQDLDYVPFHVSYVFDGIDDAHWTWQKVYVDVIEDDVPLINVKVEGRQVPFMNKESRRCIQHRKHLRRRYKKTADPTDHLKYKQQRNQTVQMSRKALAAYFRNAAKSAKDKPSEFWNTFKPFLHTKALNQIVTLFYWIMGMFSGTDPTWHRHLTLLTFAPWLKKVPIVMITTQVLYQLQMLYRIIITIKTLFALTKSPILSSLT